MIRLYTKHDHDTRRAFDVPEIARTDLAGPSLELHGAGIAGTNALRWFEAPPASAAAAAETLLERLGALAGGTITALGRRMLRFPAHPRVGRLLCEAETRGVAREACVIAGLLGARELRLDRRGPGAKAQVASPSDLIDDLDAVLGKRGNPHSGARTPDHLHAAQHPSRGLDRGTLYAVERAAKQLERIADLRARGPASAAEVDAALQLAILTAYPDRVGKRRAPRSSDFAFAGGGSGALAPSSAVIEPELIVAVDVADTGRGPQIRRASGIEASWLLDLYLDRIAERDELMWDAARERVERVVQMTYDGLVIDEHRDVESARRAGRAAAELLAKQALAAGISRFADADALAEWRARVALAAKLAPDSGLVAPTDEALAGVLAGACEGATSFAELRELNLLALLDAQLGENRALVDRLAPTHYMLPNKRRAKIHYALDQAPYLASRIQDFFGLAQAPAIGGGRVPLVLHLLAPNQRPVQVTTDLPNFWVAHYPALRRQLMRRYPRHAWPEDPRSLVAD